MEPRISLVTLGVRDIERSRRFYLDLGWTLSSASNDDVAFFHSGGAVLGLYGRDALAEDAAIAAEGSGFGGIALSHNVATREEVETVLAEAVAAGATVLNPARDVFWGGYIAHFADPDGHPWEVAWNPGFPLDAEGRVQLPD
jgi:hypothetical protein